MATAHTVFLDSNLTGYQSLASRYDASLYNVVALTGGAQQVQDYLTSHQLTPASINVISPSTGVDGLFTPRVVFVDPSVADYQTIIASLPANTTAVVLDATRDGVQQIRDYLAHNTGQVGAIDIITDIASLDVVSHGSPGEIMLGSTVLNSASVASYSAQLAEIGSHLTAGGDILLYGCDVAAGTAGQQFIADLAHATGADVAASTDTTGSAAAGGDWVLEASTGTIETVALTSANYGGTLDAATGVTAFAMSADTGTSSTDFVTKTAVQTITGSFSASTNNNSVPTIWVSTDGTGSSRTQANVTYVDDAATGTFVASNVTLVAGTGKSIQFWGAQTGNNSLGAGKPYTLDTVAPTISVTTAVFSNDSGASTTDLITATAAQTISGTLSAATVSGDVVRVSLDGGSTWQTASNTTGSTTFSLSGVTLAGSNTLKIQVEDQAGNAGTTYSRAYVLDTLAPSAGTLAFSNLTDTGTPGDGITSDRTFDLTLTGNEAGATVVYQVSTNGGSSWATTGAAQSNLADGAYQFHALVTDTAGNTSTSNSASVVIDASAPSAPTITGFSINSGSTLDTLTNDNTPTLTITAEANATVTVYQAGVPVGTATQSAPGSGIYTFTSAVLGDGSYSFTAKAADAAGNLSAASAVQSITIDTTADAGGNLAVQVADSLVSNAEKGAVAYTVTGLDADATATVTFSDGVHSVTGSNGTANLTTLTDGPITVSISATDAAGNSASGTAAATVLDTTADAGNNLAVQVGDSLVSNAEKGAVAYTVTGLDADATATVTFKDASNHSVTGSNGAANLSTLTDGLITVSISATDAAGNSANGAGAATVLDTTADVGGNLAVQVADSLVSNAEKGAVAYTVTGLDADATATVTFKDTGNHSVTGSNGTANLSTLTDGPITVSISSTDVAGNSANGAGAATVLDTTADVGGNLAVQVADSLVSNAEKGTVAYTVTGLDADATATVTFKDANNHSVTGSNGTANLSTLSDGPITVSISATDAAGNSATGTAAATVLDTTADAGSNLAVQVSDSLVNNAEKGAVAYTVVGLDSDATATVTFTDGVHSVTGAGGVANLTTLTDGPITVSISATDAADNSANGAGAATVLDTTADAGGNLAVQVSDSLVNNAEKGAVAYTITGLDADATATVTFSDGVHSVTGAAGVANLTTLSDGPISVSITALDIAGNTATGTGAATVLDTTSDAGSNLAVQVSDSLVSNAEKGTVAYTVLGLDSDATATVTFSDGVHSVMGAAGVANLSTLTDGPITVSIAAVDIAGNTAAGTGAATVLDTTADASSDLAVQVGDTLVSNAEKGAVAYTVTGLDADATATVIFSDGVHSVTGSNGTANLSTLNDGPITVSISATDAAGNSASGTGAATVLDITADVGGDLAVQVSDSLVNNAEKGTVAYTVLGLDSDATATVTFSDGVHSVMGAAGVANLTTLTDGPITVSISATDAAGNSASGAGAATVLDTTADAGSDLAVQVSDSLVNNAEKGAVAYTVVGLDSDATATVTFTDGIHSVTGAGGVANLTTLTDGPITVSVSATDAAGNSATGAGAATVLDTTADAGSNLAVQVSDSLVGNAEKGAVAYTVTGLDSDATATVTFSDGVHSVTGSNGTANLTTLKDGPITVSISALDIAGNTATGTGAATVLDTTADAGGNLAVQVSDSLVSNAEKGAVAYTVLGLDSDATATVTFSDGVHSVTGSNGTANLAALSDGLITVSISALDIAGNTATGTGAATVLDTTADAGGNLAVQVSDSLVSNAEKGAIAYTITGLDADATATVTFSDGVHSVTGSNGTANLSTLTDGPITVSISATDAAGNSANGAAAATVLDTTADVGGDLAVQVSDGLVNNAEKGTVAYTVLGLDSDATATVTFTDGIHSVTGAGGVANLTTLTDGPITVSISATDVAGNSASGAGAATVLDTTADVGGNLAVQVADSLVSNAEKGAVAYTVTGLDADATATVTFSDGVHSVTGTNGTANLATLTDGPITVSISATDAAGNSASGAGAATVLDTTADAGSDLAVQVSDSLVNNAEKGTVAYAVTGLDSDATATVTFSDGVHSVTGSNGTANLATLTDGPITVSISATDAAGNSATGAGAATVLDTTADAGSDLAVQVSDSLVNNAEKGAVAYTVTGLDADASATVTFSDGVHSVTGAGGVANLTTLTDGPITVSISATDAAGNSASGAGAATVLDTTADAGSNLAVQVSDSLVNNAEKGAVAYAITGLDADSTATVSFSDGVHSVTGSNGTANLSTLTDGPITVSISALDIAGNTATGTGAATVLDTTADVGGNLAVQVGDNLIGDAEKGAVAYTVTGLDADATATVTFSDGVHSVTGAAGVANLNTLSDGPISVSISALDIAGNTATGTGAATVLDTTADVGGNLAVQVGDNLIGDAEKGAVAYTVTGLDADATAAVTFSDGVHSVTGSNGIANLATLTDGPITVSISATDAAGNRASGAAAATVLDTTADVGGNLAVQVSDSLVNNAEKGAVAYTVAGLDSDATATVIFKDASNHSVTGSNGTANLSTLTDGPITVSISAVDAAGNNASGAGAVTVLDTTADVDGNLSVQVSDSLVNNAEKGTVAYTVTGLDSDATATVIFSDGVHSVTGSNGTANLSTLTDGPITVSISALDIAGNTATGAGAATVLDTTADAGSNLAVQVSDSLVNNAEKGAVAYTVTGLDADATATVTFSDGVHSVTGSNGTANLAALTDGPITVSISATDAAGNTATGTGAATVLDTTADVGGNLAVQVGDNLIGDAEKGAVTYTVTGLDADATATVTFSDGVHSVTGAAGVANLSTLSDGPISVSISALDIAGNSATGTGAATVLDTTADAGGNLAVQVSDSLVNNAEKGTVAYTVVGLDSDATATVIFKDAGNHSVTGSNGIANLSTLTDGPITVSISAVDIAGNSASGAAAATVLDTTADAGGNLAVQVADSLVSNAEKGTVAYTVTGLDADSTATVTFKDASNHTVTGINGIANLATLTDGPITVSISAVDAAGNSASGAGAATVLDTTADGGSDLAVQVSDSLVSNAEKGTVAYTVTGLDADAAATVIFKDGSNHTVIGNNGIANLSTLTDGPITVSISATDVAGNTASGAGAATVLDTTADVAGNLAVQVSDSLVNNAEKGAVAYTVTGLDSDATATVIFSDGVHTVTGAAGVVDLSTLSDGPISVSISAADIAGNIANGAGAALTLDTTLTAPTVTLFSDTGDSSDRITSNAALVFGAKDVDATRAIMVDGKGVSGYNAGSLQDGAHTVVVTDTDAAGNAKSATLSFTLDKTAPNAPNIALATDSSDGASGHAGDKISNSAALTFSPLEQGATRTFLVDSGKAASAYVAPTAEGAHQVTVTDTDIAGNATTTSFSFTLDTKADPENDLAVSLADQLISFAERGAVAYNLQGLNADANATVTFSDGVHTAIGSNGLVNLAGLTDGAIAVSVSATDYAGNVAQGVGASLALDTAAPIFTSAATATLAENSGANLLVYQAAATDARAFSYSLLANNNDDAGQFSLGADGAVRLLANPDFEAKSKYDFTLVATDAAGNMSQKAVTLNITDVNEAPTAAAISLSTVENAAIVIPVIPDYAFDVDAGDAVKLMSVGQCTLSWAADTSSTSLVNPVTKQVLNLSQVYAKATIGSDGKSITITSSDEFDWASTGQKVNATMSYSVCDNAGVVSTSTITLTIWGSTADKGKNLNGGNGNDTLTGTDGENVLQGANGNDILTGGAATDALYGGNGDDKIYGNGGIDYLYGDSGNDLLDGGAARDVLFGGKGNDTLIGGTGADCFVFEAQMGNDRVSDFRMSEGDKLYFVDVFTKPITAAEFVSKYVTHVGSDLLISVPGGSITLVGVSDTAALANAIAFTMPT